MSVRVLRMKAPMIAVLGGINIDLVIRCKVLPRIGETVKGTSYNQFPGGKGANQAVAAAKLGGNVAMIGAVGCDVFGSTIINNMRDISIDVTHIKKVEDVPTGTAFIFVDKNGQNLISFIGGANDEVNSKLIDEVEYMIKEADVFLVQLECPVQVVEYAIKKASSFGTPVILNPSPAVPLSNCIIRRSTILIPNESEAEILTGYRVEDKNSYYKASTVLIGRGCKNVVITLGEKGAYLHYPDHHEEVIPAPRVNAMDTVAAGDVFAGAFAVRFAMGEDLKKAVIYSNHAAAISTTRAGAQTSIPSMSEVEEYIKSSRG
jgi:ribokinase